MRGKTDRPPHTGAVIVDAPSILEERGQPSSSKLKLLHDYKVIVAPGYMAGVLRVCGHCGQILGFKRLETGWELLLKGDGSCANS